MSMPLDPHKSSSRSMPHRSLDNKPEKGTVKRRSVDSAAHNEAAIAPVAANSPASKSVERKMRNEFEKNYSSFDILSTSSHLPLNADVDIEAAAPTKKRKRKGVTGGNNKAFIDVCAGEEATTGEFAVLNILDLPDKILIMIFDNLGLQDRGNARVCKKFCEIEEKSEESQSKTMDQLVIKVTQGLIRFDGSNMPKACVGEKYTYECAILLMKRLARIFTIDSISFESIPTPKTSVEYSLLHSILNQNRLISIVKVECRMKITEEELKELRKIVLSRLYLGEMTLEDIPDTTTKAFGYSVMGIDPVHLMQHKSYKDFYPFREKQDWDGKDGETYCSGYSLNLREDGVLTSLVSTKRMRGRIGHITCVISRIWHL